MNKDLRVEYYLDKLQNSNFELHHIRKELEIKNIPDEEIRAIVKQVDEELQRTALTKASKGRVKEILLSGIISTVFGAGITIGTYLGVIDMGDSFLVVYGPFFAGLSITIGAYNQYRKL